MLAFVVALVYSYKGTWQSFDSKDGKYNDLGGHTEDGREVEEEPLTFSKNYFWASDTIREQNSYVLWYNAARHSLNTKVANG